MTVSRGYWCLRTMTDVHEKPREESINIAGRRLPFHHFVFDGKFFLDMSHLKRSSVRNWVFLGSSICDARGKGRSEAWKKFRSLGWSSRLASNSPRTTSLSW